MNSSQTIIYQLKNPQNSSTLINIRINEVLGFKYNQKNCTHTKTQSTGGVKGLLIKMMWIINKDLPTLPVSHLNVKKQHTKLRRLVEPSVHLAYFTSASLVKGNWWCSVFLTCTFFERRGLTGTLDTTTKL